MEPEILHNIIKTQKICFENCNNQILIYVHFESDQSQNLVIKKVASAIVIIWNKIIKGKFYYTFCQTSKNSFYWLISLTHRIATGYHKCVLMLLPYFICFNTLLTLFICILNTPNLHQTYFHIYIYFYPFITYIHHQEIYCICIVDITFMNVTRKFLNPLSYLFILLAIEMGIDMLQMMQDHYPEVWGNIFVINGKCVHDELFFLKLDTEIRIIGERCNSTIFPQLR